MTNDLNIFKKIFSKKEFNDLKNTNKSLNKHETFIASIGFNYGQGVGIYFLKNISTNNINYWEMKIHQSVYANETTNNHNDIIFEKTMLLKGNIYNKVKLIK
jgi:hypothetical protein